MKTFQIYQESRRRRKNLGELLAEPHKEYLTTLDPVLDDINAISHITGGGLRKNLPRVFDKKLTS